MIKLCPIPLWYRLSELSRQALILYQWENHGLVLEIPPYIIPEFQTIKPIINTDEAEREIRRAPSRQVRVQ
jgi:hypothetical protein